MSALLLDFERRGPLADRRPVAAAFARLAARGPDGRDEFTAPEGHLAVAELAATRLAAGGGALAVDPAGQVALALDGRVDAVDGVERTLPAPPGDAALLLERYLEHGDAFLDAVAGSFVVALLDRRRPWALAARDGMGNRHAAYVLDGERFAVASDDDALLALPGIGRDLHPGRLAAFYGSAELAGPETFFRQVSALLPGEMLRVEPDTVSRRLLPRPDPAARLRLPRWEDYVEAFAERLETAVRRRLRGARRVAVWLSGGLDSSPVAALAARALPPAAERVVGLCWKVADPAGDETAWAAATARHGGFPLIEVDCAGAGPFAPLATWPVRASTPEQTAYRRFHDLGYARARELAADAVLWGFGGDMLYAAPRRWFWDLLAAEGAGAAIDRLRQAAGARGAWRALRGELLAPLVPAGLRRLLGRPASPAPPPWLTAEARRLLDGRPAWPPALGSARRPRQAERLLALLDAFGVGIEGADAARCGLELRTPLRDRGLVEFALAVPDHLLLQGDETRPVVRAASRGLLPEEVRRRRGKADFSATVMRALRPERRPWAAGLLGRPDALWRGFVEPAAIDRWLADCPTGGGDDLGFCLALYSELWHRRGR